MKTEFSLETSTATTTSTNLYNNTIVANAPQYEPPRLPAPVHRNLHRTGSSASELVDIIDQNIIATTTNTNKATSNHPGKLPRSRFKGVVPQPNARWGCQIYQNSRRIWLGTFVEEEQAAQAYDAAAKRFRGPGAVTNFKSHEKGDSHSRHVKEMSFLNSLSEDEIVNMLRKHTYEDQLEQVISSAENGDDGKDHDVNNSNGKGHLRARRELLFEKTLTHSDVGRLNRLVIPKVHAEKHFPIDGKSCKDDILMTFQESSRGGKLWRFRYSYWKSSQSYVLTKGWFRFVRENKLTAGDVVSFQQSTGWDRKLFIDYCKMTTANKGLVKEQQQPEHVVRRRPVMMRLFGRDIFKVDTTSE